MRARLADSSKIALQAHWGFVEGGSGPGPGSDADIGRRKDAEEGASS